MTHKHGRVYDLRNCLDCVVSLVFSARPSRARQDAFIAHAANYWPVETIMQALEEARR